MNGVESEGGKGKKMKRVKGACEERCRSEGGRSKEIRGCRPPSFAAFDSIPSLY